VPERDPTCSVSDCTRPTDGVLTIATAAGDVRLSACEHHGRRASDGDWFTYELLGSTYLLGRSADDARSAHYEPLLP
jgi:hypothetical protein